MNGDMAGRLPATMRAAQINELGPLTHERSRLRLTQVETPRPGAGEVTVAVRHCGVCHTELDEIEGRTPPSRVPMTPGHQVVGTVVQEGADCTLGLLGQTVGVAWIHSACGACSFCRRGLENLCPDFQACGRDQPGGYAEYMTAPEAFVHPLPSALDPERAAPLLCAGAVGIRALRLAELENGAPLGLTGFGASGQLVLPIARHRYPDSPVFVFARSGREREIALELGAAWAGNTTESPPIPLRAIIDTTPAWLPVISALAALEPGGRVIVNAIRKEPQDQELLANLSYENHLWCEKSLTTVANVTRRDVREALSLAAEIGLSPRVREYALDQAGEALLNMRSGAVESAGVLRLSPQAA